MFFKWPNVDWVRTECARKIFRLGHEERFQSRRPSEHCRNTSTGNEKDSVAYKNIAPKNDNLVSTLWKIRNLPEKMSTLGVIRFITNLGVVVEEKKSMYQVLSIKNHKSSRGVKVEAVLSMTEEMGKRLMSHNGIEVENVQVEISRTKKCRLGHKWSR